MVKRLISNREKFTPWVKVIYLVVFLAIFVSGGYALLVNQIVWPQIATYNPRLSQCTGHLQNNTHYHTQLNIVFNGQNYPVTENIGIKGECMHPVHTHDGTGLIHVDYPTPYKFTLGDFFNTWGIIFNKRQLGNIRIEDGYRITMKVNGIVINEFEKYVLRDRDQIDLTISENKQ